MIRFGVVLTVVLAAMGLLAGGVLANSLLLVYLAIGAAALAAIMLTVGVLIWREDVFGPSSAAQASPAAKQAAGPSPVLAATGVASPGRSAGGTADDVATIGATAAQDDLVAEPPPRALPPRQDWAGRPEPQGYPDWPAPPQQQEQPDRLQRSDRPRRQETPDLAGSSDRPEQPDWAKRSDRTERQEQPDSAKPSDGPERGEQADSAKPSDRAERSAHLEPRKVAEPAAGQGSAGQERPSRSPSGAWPEPLAEPVPGPRRGDEPASGGVRPASRGAAAADELKPRPAREPAAQSQGEPDADVPAWSFFTKAVKPTAARTDVTQVIRAGAGAEPKAALTAEAAPDAARPPTRTAEDEDRAAAAPDAAGSDTGRAAGRDRDPAGPVKRDAPAEPEPASAVAEEAEPDDAAVADPEAEDESPADTATGSATRDGHPARGPDTEVTVVPGITRYHRNQCILIRFLGPEDLETMTLQAAEMASYMPCRACRPEQVLAGD